MPDLSRRRFIASGASLGALTFLTGCDVSDSFSADKLLAQISKFNDGVQAAIFNPNALAPTFSEKDITRPFRSTPITMRTNAPEVDGKTYKLEVFGLVENKKSWTLDELYQLPRSSRSPGISASRAGARSAAGRARRCATSSS